MCMQQKFSTSSVTSGHSPTGPIHSLSSSLFSSTNLLNLIYADAESDEDDLESS